MINRRSSRKLRSLLLGLTLLTLPLAGLGINTTPASAGSTVTGTGSSYAAIAINAWVSQVFTSLGLNINYQATSSVIGLENFAQSLVDFGASEIGYSAGQTQSSPPAGYQYMPDVAGATCLMYNVSGSTGQQVQQLELTPALIGKIFTGQITYWNDPQITALNPTALLSHVPIVVVARSDASGDNYIFSDYLATVDPGDWSGFTRALLGQPEGPSATWPTPSGGGTTVGNYNEGNWDFQAGSDNASNFVASSLNSITYVETGYATEHNMPCAYVQNASGGFIRPSELGDAYALESDQINLATGEQSLAPVFLSPNPQAYPISAYSYLVTQSSGISAAKGAVLSAFILFLACQGQQSAGKLGYSPLPTNLVVADFNAISKINGHVALPATIDASTCPNPYITGELQSLGEPPLLGAPTGSYTGVNASGTSSTATSKDAGTGGASAVLTPKKGAGGTQAAGGQTPGLALLAANNKLMGQSGPTAEMVGWTLGFLAVLGVPAFFLITATRRRTSAATLAAEGVALENDESAGDEGSELNGRNER
jgi:phosphate transport system substrate-binding protein